jgi:hypothetical protein
MRLAVNCSPTNSSMPVAGICSGGLANERKQIDLPGKEAGHKSSRKTAAPCRAANGLRPELMEKRGWRSNQKAGRSKLDTCSMLVAAVTAVRLDPIECHATRRMVSCRERTGRRRDQNQTWALAQPRGPDAEEAAVSARRPVDHEAGRTRAKLAPGKAAKSMACRLTCRMLRPPQTTAATTNSQSSGCPGPEFSPRIRAHRPTSPRRWSWWHQGRGKGR